MSDQFDDEQKPFPPRWFWWFFGVAVTLGVGTMVYAGWVMYRMAEWLGR